MEPKIGNLVAGQHPQISLGIWVGQRFSAKKRAKYLKPGEAGQWLLLITNRKLHMRFRLVVKSTTLDDLEWPLCTFSN